MLLGISLTDKFAKIVVGYFLYGSARNTAMKIDRGGRGLFSTSPPLSDSDLSQAYAFLKQDNSRRNFR